jgi:Rps23 Pro-64 3,4-dihydroxylase Tpa1-like proline 4-hydroxylase
MVAQSRFMITGWLLNQDLLLQDGCSIKIYDYRMVAQSRFMITGWLLNQDLLLQNGCSA